MARPQTGALPATPTTIAFGDTASPGAAGDNAALATHRHGMVANPAITDHGGLSGLADDDHARYADMYNQAAAPSNPVADRPTLWFDTDEVGGFYASPSGTAFPASPTTYQRFFRTDIRGGMWFIWNGTYWLSEQTFTVERSFEGIATGAGGFAIIVGSEGNTGRGGFPRDTDIFITHISGAWYCASLNNGTDYRHFQLHSHVGAVYTVIADFLTNTSPQDQWSRIAPQTLSVLLSSASGGLGWEIRAAKSTTGVGITYLEFQMGYRLRAT